MISAACAGTPPPTGVQEVEDFRPEKEVPSQDQVDLLCSGGTKVEAGPVSASTGTFPCEYIRTLEAVRETEGRGFLMGALPRFFLKVRMVTRGIFGAVFGLFGLG